MLGLHEDIQDKVREELDKVTGCDGIEHRHTQNGVCSLQECKLARKLLLEDITVEQIREMKYLERVIKESLRMWPSIPFVARHMTEDLLLGKLSLDEL